MDWLDEHMPTFLRNKASTVGPDYSKKAGQKIFWRLDDERRLLLTSRLIDLWLSNTPLNRPAIASAFREAWDSEPCLGGVRWGSYLTESLRRSGFDVYSVLEDLLVDCGREFMNSKERRSLAAMRFPRPIFRGGVGEHAQVANGKSWTLDLEVAKFYATSWPKRSGDLRPPVVFSTVIDRSDVVALLNGRDEGEVLIPRPYDIAADLQMVAL
jgi:hypothetical protein